MDTPAHASIPDVNMTTFSPIRHVSSSSTLQPISQSQFHQCLPHLQPLHLLHPPPPLLHMTRVLRSFASLMGDARSIRTVLTSTAVLLRHHPAIFALGVLNA